MVDMIASGTNLMMDVQNWKDAMFFRPLALMAAGSQRPTRQSEIASRLTSVPATTIVQPRSQYSARKNWT